MSPATAKHAMETYQAICSSMLIKSDYSEIQGKKHKNKSAWRKLARAFNISDFIIQETKDVEGQDFVWRIWVRASSPSGRFCIGIGACSTKERGFAHRDHDVYATAHTRAKNRAISDLIGSGEVSAEEIEAPKDKVTYFEGGNRELLKK